MNGLHSLDALRRANPRHDPRFPDAVDTASQKAAQVPFEHAPEAASPNRWQRQTGRIGRPAVAGVLAIAAAGALLVFGTPFTSSSTGTVVAMQEAVAVSAQAADDSGTVAVTITSDGNLWAAKIVQWNGADVSITGKDPGRGRGELRVVNGTLYEQDPEIEGGWLDVGSPDNIDPGSGTTPDEYLAAVRDDAGGATLRRLTEAMSELSTTRTDDGSTVYTGTVRADALAPETGFKDGETLRVLPYGYVAHDAAADPASPIAVSITIGPDSTIRVLEATWGGASAWTYRLKFSDLGATPAPTVPQPVRSLAELRGLCRGEAASGC